MKRTTIASAILWVAALGAVAYLFKGQENMPIAVILLGILGFVDVITSQGIDR